MSITNNTKVFNIDYTYYNDNEPYCCQVLRKNIRLGYLPGGYVDERDIRALHASDFVGYQHVHLFAGIGGFPLGLKWANFPSSIRVLTGGFPCQDISNAGKRAGLDGERSGLWYEMYRLIQEASACDLGFDYILLENVAALVNRGLNTVLGCLSEAGYDAVWTTLRASDVGAPHQRERVFLVAYTSGTRQGRLQQERQPQCDHQTRTLNDGKQKSVANTQSNDEGRRRSGTSPALSRLTCIGTNMADTSSTGQQERDTSPITGDERHPAWRNLAPGKERLVEDSTSRRERQHQDTGGPQGTQSLTLQPSTRDAQSLLGRVFARLSAGLDRYRFPAGPSSEQHAWEPARTTTGKQPHRVARLKALGNALLPQLVEIIGRSIVDSEGVA